MNSKKPPKDNNASIGPEDELPKERKSDLNTDLNEKDSKTIPEPGDVEGNTADMLERMIKEGHKLAVELAEEKDKHMRVAAEYDNFRKRSQKERETIYTEVRADTIEKILPVFDNLERALNQKTEDESYRKGIELTMSQLRDILQGMGVFEIDASPGKKFNPEFHNAVMHVEDENLGESVVVEEFQRGFKLGEKVLRYSAVKVAN